MINFIVAGGPIMILIAAGAVMALVIIIAFLSGAPVMSSEKKDDAQKVGIQPTGDVTINISVMSGFKFGIGLMLSFLLVSIISVPVAILFLSSFLR